jgi:hypothetical protein
MIRNNIAQVVFVLVVMLLAGLSVGTAVSDSFRPQELVQAGAVVVDRAIRFDVSAPLASLPDLGAVTGSRDCAGAACGTSPGDPDANAVQDSKPDEPTPPPAIPSAAASVEQTSQGKRVAVPTLDSFDGLGAGFEGPQGTANFRNPSDNSLAVGTQSHCADRQHADRGVHQEGGAV